MPNLITCLLAFLLIVVLGLALVVASLIPNFNNQNIQHAIADAAAAC